MTTGSGGLISCYRGVMADHETTIHNERTKLTATYLNGAAIAVLAIGAFAPLFSAFGSGFGQSAWVIPAQLVICVAVSAILHVAARRFLGRLRP